MYIKNSYDDLSSYKYLSFFYDSKNIQYSYNITQSSQKYSDSILLYISSQPYYSSHINIPLQNISSNSKKTINSHEINLSYQLNHSNPYKISNLSQNNQNYDQPNMKYQISYPNPQIYKVNQVQMHKNQLAMETKSSKSKSSAQKDVN